MAETGFDAPSPAAALRNLMRTEDTLDCPGAYDALSARVALNYQFLALYVSVIGACGSCMTQADADSGAQTEFQDHVEMIAELGMKNSAVVIADDETGAGDAVMADRMVKRHIKGTVAAVVISDRLPALSKSAHGNDSVMSEQQFLERVNAASNVRKSHGDSNHRPFEHVGVSGTTRGN
ncbi:Pyruvate/Phosphoenolpyruvate kinase-like domain-containing protein [Aspergillus undulatus]|uniref:Pyruvate/Phosphoenolpyruvate kinase-like domain-containing protein n=1 Tax=Aspergillus undulatus TaxID=1810928 RepID=UPI003CCD754B